MPIPIELMKHLGYSDAEIEEAIASGAATGETEAEEAVMSSIVTRPGGSEKQTA